jgi:hypothetical protein
MVSKNSKRPCLTLTTSTPGHPLSLVISRKQFTATTPTGSRNGHDTMQTSRTLEDGCMLEVVVNSYADRLLVLITQLGKVGNLVGASFLPIWLVHLPHLNYIRSKPPSRIRLHYRTSLTRNYLSLLLPSTSLPYSAALHQNICKHYTPSTHLTQQQWLGL